MLPEGLRANEPPSVFGKAKDQSAAILGKVSETISGFVGKMTSDERDNPKLTPEEEELIAVRDSCLRSVMVERSGFHFTQSQWGEKPITYQLKGFRVCELDEQVLSSADTANGIDRRVVFRFKTEGFRRYDPERGWGDWRAGGPPELTGMTLVRELGVWKVISSPQRMYAVPI